MHLCVGVSVCVLSVSSAIGESVELVIECWRCLLAENHVNGEEVMDTEQFEDADMD